MDNRLQLPNEVSFLIYSFLQIEDILSYVRTSKENYRISSTPCLWKTLGQRDFYLNIKENNESKQSYVQLKLGISREKERFIFYMTAHNLIEIVIEKKDQNNEFNEEELGNPLLQMLAKMEKKKIACKNLIKNLDICTLQSEEAFKEYYNGLIQSVNESERNSLNHFRKQSHELYTLLISHSFEEILKIIQENNDNSMYEEAHKILYVSFLALCQLDASISIGIILSKNDITTFSKFLIGVFQLPCLKVIKRLLDFNIELNEKSWTSSNGHNRMHITPLVAAILCMINGKQMNTSKEIISLLLEKGANTKLPVFITDDDWDSEEEEEEYNKRCRPIRELCYGLIAIEAEKFEDKHDRKIFIESMQMIINHEPKKSINFSKIT